MVDCKFQCAMSCSGASGLLPYSAMPGRTQSVCAAICGWRSRAALLQALRSPGNSAVVWMKLCQALCKPGSATSAVAKWVIQPMSSTCGMACRRVHTARARWGAKPRRFMPVLIFRKTVCGCKVLWAASMASCSSLCTACQMFSREHSSRSRGSNTPSSNKMGPRQPRSRSSCASCKSSKAKPSAPCRASYTRAMPCP